MAAQPPEVQPVSNRQTLRAFINYPYHRYRHDPHWVPPLRLLEWQRFDPRRNPFYDHAAVELLLARRDGRVVGRIAAIDDGNHNAVHHENLATFGCFEADDQPAASALLQAAEQWARDRGRAAMRGPLSLSMNEIVGLLIDGFDEDPMVLMPYNPPVYREYIEHEGYTKLKDLYAWLLEPRADLGEREVALTERVRQRLGVTIRTIDMRRFDEEFATLLDIFRRAWQDNWGFVAPTLAEARHTTKELRQIVDPRYVICADVGGQTVGFLVAVPDLNQALKGTNGRLFPLGLARFLTRRWLIDQYRLLLLGVLPEYKRSGLYPVMIASLLQQSQGTRWRRLEMSWVLEDNVDTNVLAERSGARRYTTYRLFQKDL